MAGMAIPFVLAILVAIIGVIIIVVLVGIAAGLIGVGGMAAASYATKKNNRTLILLAFGMLLLFGAGCILAVAAFLLGIIWLSVLGILVGLSTIACAVVGIVFSKKVVEKKAFQILFYVLFCIGVLAGAVVSLVMLGLFWMSLQLPYAAAVL